MTDDVADMTEIIVSVSALVFASSTEAYCAVIYVVRPAVFVNHRNNNTTSYVEFCCDIEPTRTFVSLVVDRAQVG